VPGSDPGSDLRRLWARLSPLPGGRWLFSRLLGWRIPYSGSIRPEVRELASGTAAVSLAERRAVRNHLGSVHAIALANLGELTTGLALVPSLPPGVRGIVTGLEVDYRKKARGRLICRAVVELPGEVPDRLEHRVAADITDADGDVVARVEARWLLSSRSSSRTQESAS